jgi:hypothetical protein
VTERTIAAQEFARFRQSVRSRIRQHVRRNREAPPLTLWASEGENPRRVRSVPVGAAVGPVEVRQNVVAGIRERESSYAAIGRLLHLVDESTGDERVPTSVYGLVVACSERVEGWEVDIVAGRVGAWRTSRIGDGVEGPDHAWFWLNQAIRGARRATP